MSEMDKRGGVPLCIGLAGALKLDVCSEKRDDSLLI